MLLLAIWVFVLFNNFVNELLAKEEHFKFSFINDFRVHNAEKHLKPYIFACVHIFQ